VQREVSQRQEDWNEDDEMNQGVDSRDKVMCIERRIRISNEDDVGARGRAIRDEERVLVEQ